MDFERVVVCDAERWFELSMTFCLFDAWLYAIFTHHFCHHPVCSAFSLRSNSLCSAVTLNAATRTRIVSVSEITGGDMEAGNTFCAITNESRHLSSIPTL